MLPEGAPSRAEAEADAPVVATVPCEDCPNRIPVTAGQLRRALEAPSVVCDECMERARLHAEGLAWRRLRFMVRLVHADGVELDPLRSDDLLEACRFAVGLEDRNRGRTCHIDVIDMERVDPPCSGVVDHHEVLAREADYAVEGCEGDSGVWWVVRDMETGKLMEGEHPSEADAQLAAYAGD